MEQLYGNLYRWIIFLLLAHIAIIPIQASSPVLTNGRLKLGAKLGYEGGFRLIESDFISYFPAELFIAYHFKTIDKGPRYPLFGFWGNRYESFELQMGICYKSINMSGMRKDIEPNATFFLYHHGQEIGSITFNVKILSLPITLKSYMGKIVSFV